VSIKVAIFGHAKSREFIIEVCFSAPLLLPGYRSKLSQGNSPHFSPNGRMLYFTENKSRDLT